MKTGGMNVRPEYTFLSIGRKRLNTEERRRAMMKWEAEAKGYTCNDCFLSMQNCHDMSICCEDESGLCDYFEEMERKGEQP